MKVVTAKCKIWKNKTEKTPLNAISIVYFRYARLGTEKFSRTSTIHVSISAGRALFKL